MSALIVFGLVTLTYSAAALGPLTFGVNSAPKCEPSVTTASGTHVKRATFCKGDLIFEDTFDVFDFKKWQHENTLSGGGNWEFQWYTNNRSNSFCAEGHLHIRPTLTSDAFGEEFLSSGIANLHGGAPADQCTNPAFWGCERTGNPAQIINPIRSARLRTVESFSFKYGKLEISAKLPSGDWLWPAIWMMPRDNVYGSWPASGEIDIAESRGNRDYIQKGINIGHEQVSSTLHFGPNWALNAYPTSHFARNSHPGNGWSNDFHRYQMEWSPDKIIFSVDDIEAGTINVGDGFWARGGFDASAPGTDNPWKFATPMAPFDQEFYIIMNLAVGGTVFFPDDAINPGGKPWTNTSPTAARDFWNGRNSWLPTWKLEQNWSSDASLIVDYVRVWAL